MSSKRKQAEFDSVEDVFATYIPDYQPSPGAGESPRDSALGPEAGVRLAESLLRKLQSRLEPSISGRKRRQ